MNAVIAEVDAEALHHILEDPHVSHVSPVIDYEPALSEMQAMAHLLDSMLVGLVPIRGRLQHYDCVTIEGKEVLVHRSLLNEIEDGTQLQTHPAFVVGVAQRDLFWKDIRRVCSQELHTQYSVAWRLAD